MEIKPSNISKEKKPLYIAVYDKLFKLIMDGTFPSQSKLPTEPELAKRLGVSRMTLRQALALLQDDGLVNSIHGKGNFITKTSDIKKADGLDKIGNPIYKCHTETIDDVELYFSLELDSEYTHQILKRKTGAVVAFDRWYKRKGEVVAYSFTFMAIEVVSELNLDLKNERQILEMLERKVYELANSSKLEIKHSNFMSVSPSKYTLVGGEQCNLLLESVYINEEYPIIYNKHYIPQEFSSLKINAKK